MVDTRTYGRLLAAIDRSGAKLLLVGDDRQLGSIERGGLFRVFLDELGPERVSGLERVRPQRSEWQRAATTALAEGRFADAVEAYGKHEAIVFGKTLEDARLALVRQWMADERERPESVRFVYAQTNLEVTRLNAEIQAAREAAGDVRTVCRYETERRGEPTETDLGVGDRVQLYGTDHERGLMNGYCGTVRWCEPARIELELDGGGVVAWNPREYREWGLGNAGTVYRGQGKTQTEAYYLHTAFAEVATSYVAWTRHTDRLRVYAGRDITPDQRSLAIQMSRHVERGSSLAFEVYEPGREPEREPDLDLSERWDELVGDVNVRDERLAERVVEPGPIDVEPTPAVDVPGPEEPEDGRYEIFGLMWDYLKAESGRTPEGPYLDLWESVAEWVGTPDGETFLQGFAGAPAETVLHAVALRDPATEALLNRLPQPLLPMDRQLAAIEEALGEAVAGEDPGPQPTFEGTRSQVLKHIDTRIEEVRREGFAVIDDAGVLRRMFGDPAKSQKDEIRRFESLRNDIRQGAGDGMAVVAKLHGNAMAAWQKKHSTYMRACTARDEVRKVRAVGLEERSRRVGDLETMLNTQQRWDLAAQLGASLRLRPEEWLKTRAEQPERHHDRGMDIPM